MAKQVAKTNPTNGEEYFHKLDNLLLSSTYFLHNVFQARWNLETRTYWESTEQNGKEVWKGLAPHIPKQCEGFSKKLIETGCLNEWDLPTICFVLQYYGKCRLLYKDQNEGVKRLIKLADDLHNTSKAKRNPTRVEYHRHLKVFKESLKAFNMSDEMLNEMINDVGVTCSATYAWAMVKSLFKIAHSHVIKKEFENALIYHSKLIEIPGLLPVHQSFGFEKRSQCYTVLAQQLKIKNDPEWSTVIDKAITDAKTAQQLNNNCWNAHLILARCYVNKGKYKEALFHYEQVLKISPGQQRVRQEFKECKVLEKMKTVTDGSKTLPQKTEDLPKEGESKNCGGGGCDHPSSSSSSSKSSTVPNGSGISAFYKVPTFSETVPIQPISNSKNK